MESKVRLSRFFFACLQTVCVGAWADAGNPRTNQIGYLPNGAKIASYKTQESTPQTWRLYKNGEVVARGETSPGYADVSSGDHLQQIDFSAVRTMGSGFSLQVGPDTSYAFAISPTVFRAPLYDALKYFYHNRSGVAIAAQFTGGGNTSYKEDSKWARAAGHVNQGANRGDLNVPCWEDTCQYALDVPKGWYDAGDHGKYVVNAGHLGMDAHEHVRTGAVLGNNSTVERRCAPYPGES